MSANLNNFIRPCGATDNASDYGSEDSRFESWQGRVIFFKIYFNGNKSFVKKIYNFYNNIDTEHNTQQSQNAEARRR
jgi:hypothetical protein